MENWISNPEFYAAMFVKSALEKLQSDREIKRRFFFLITSQYETLENSNEKYSHNLLTISFPQISIYTSVELVLFWAELLEGELRLPKNLLEFSQSSKISSNSLENFYHKLTVVQFCSKNGSFYMSKSLQILFSSVQISHSNSL